MKNDGPLFFFSGPEVDIQFSCPLPIYYIIMVMVHEYAYTMPRTGTLNYLNY